MLVEYVTGKVNRVLGLLRRNLKKCTKELRGIAYLSMVVRPIDEYASPVWDPT